MILAAVAATVLAFRTCPDVAPDGFADWTDEQKNVLKQRCSDVDADPVYLGRLRNRSTPLQFGAGSALVVHGDLVSFGPSLRVGIDLQHFAFIAIDGRVTFGDMHNSQSGAVSVGPALSLGEWQLRVGGAFGVVRSELQWPFSSTGFAVLGGASAELVLPNRHFGLSLDAGVTQPVWATRLLTRDLRPRGQATVTLTWYFA